MKLTVDHLKLEGNLISQQAVARTASINQGELRHCSSARAIIDRAVEEYRAMRLEQREDKLINDMREALHTLNSKGEAVTRTAVSREIHVLKRRNQLREIIEEAQIAPGEPVSLLFSLMPIANVFKIGHRLVLEMGSRSDLLEARSEEGFVYFQNEAPPYAARKIVYHSGTSPSHPEVEALPPEQ